MAGRIRKEDIESLRERADIAAVVGDYTSLKRAGQRLKGLCPFHQEKTPSFTVDPARNLFHCFGCGEGGDIYSFLMKVEGLDFAEAVEQLARRSGFTLHYEEMSAGEKRALGERSRLVEVNQVALEFYRAALYDEIGTVARDYLKSRGFAKEDADHFQLGFAPNDWDVLSRQLQRDGISQADLVRVGLAARNDRGGLRDRFRGRLLFPIRDLSGDVIGFGGRVLPGLDYGNFDPPKYLNTPETPLYHKQRVLYGLHLARPEIVRAEQVLVCEGYTDVMALHQAGFGNAVATCGTAVGSAHLELLSRYANRVVLAFDADAAGAAAAERAWEHARPHGLDVRVLVLPAGKDPADAVREDGVESLREAVEAATPVVPFVLRRTIEAHDLDTEEGRVAALKAAVAILGEVDDPDVTRLYARTEVADRIGVSIEFVEQSAERAGVRLDRHAGVASAGRSSSRAASATTRRAQIERAVLRVAFQRPDLLTEEWEEVAADHFSHPKARALYEALQRAGGAGAAVDEILEAATDDDERTLVRSVALEDITEELDPGQVVRDLLAFAIDADVTALRDELARLNVRTDPERARELLTRQRQLEERRRALRRFDG